jgi:glycerol-1-phosphate dehydrogenase [NAD(P)+]
MINLPVQVIVGKGVLHLAGEVLSKHITGDKVVVLTGPTIKSLYLTTLIESVELSGFSSSVVVVESPSLSEVDRVVRSLPSASSAVIGLGGGKVLDVGKVAAYRAGTPFVSVPTSASHDGIASPQASLKGLNGAHSVKVNTPYVVIADSEIISSSPKRLTLSGIGDVLAKLSSVLDSRLAQEAGEYVGDYSISLAEMSAKLVLNNLSTIVGLTDSGIRTLLEALISNGIAMAIAGSSRPCSGSEHLFGHALDFLTSRTILHGFTVLLGTKISLALHGQDWASFSDEVSQAGLPTNAKQLGIPSVYVVRALLFANKMRPERFTILSNGISLARAQRVVEELKII